jgi:hypothetical protein
LLIALSLPSIAAADSSPLGYVTKYSGAWYDRQYKKDVEVMYQLHMDSQVIRNSSAPADSLTVRFNSNPKDPQTFSCGANNSCSPVDLVGRQAYLQPAPKKEQGFLGVFLSAASDIMNKDPNQYRDYATTMSRGDSNLHLNDAVAQLTANGVDLGDAFGTSPAAGARIALCPIGASGEVTCPPNLKLAPFTRIWKSPMEPGPYRLYACGKDETIDAGSCVDSVVLILREPSYSKARALFAQARSVTKGWANPDSSIPALLRAYLLSLAPK